MKYIIGFLLLVCGLFYFTPDSDDAYRPEVVLVKIKITKIETGKYSKIEGYFKYDDEVFKIDNGLEGYYQKRYNLRVNDTIEEYVKLYFYKNKEGGRSITVGSEINSKKYEMND